MVGFKASNTRGELRINAVETCKTSIRQSEHDVTGHQQANSVGTYLKFTIMGTHKLPGSGSDNSNNRINPLISASGSVIRLVLAFFGGFFRLSFGWQFPLLALALLTFVFALQIKTKGNKAR